MMRRKWRCNLTDLIDRGNPTLDEVLNHEDLATALRNDADQLVTYLFDRQPGRHIDEMIRFALYDTSNPRRTSKAAQFLSAPARRLQSRLYRDGTFLTEVTKFPDSENAQNPVSISNFERIAQMALSQEPELLKNQFKGLFLKMLHRIEYLGYRELLTHLIQEHPLCEFFYEPPAEGYFILANFAAECSDRLIKLGKPADNEAPSDERELLTRRLMNIFSVLIELFAGTDVTVPPADLNTEQFIRLLCEAALPPDPSYPTSVVASGVHAIQAIVMNFVEEKLNLDGTESREPYNRRNNVSGYLKEFSKSWCRRVGLLEQNFDPTRLDPKRKLYIMIAFPVVWYAAIDPLFPLFWESTPAVTEFTQAMYYRIENMSITRLSRFAKDHKLVDEFINRLCYSPKKNPEENGIILANDVVVLEYPDRMLALNPQIWLLLKLIVFGKTSKDAKKWLPLPRNKDDKEKWEAFSILVVKKVLPYTELW
jgi:hypothetical protein